MEIMLNNEGAALTVALTGRLDTRTAPELEHALEENLPGKTDVTFDLAGLEYISSAGLRVFLKAQKNMNRQGSMRLIHVCPAVMEIFEMTGFTDLLTIE